MFKQTQIPRHLNKQISSWNCESVKLLVVYKWLFSFQYSDGVEAFAVGPNQPTKKPIVYKKDHILKPEKNLMVLT